MRASKWDVVSVGILAIVVLAMGAMIIYLTVQLPNLSRNCRGGYVYTDQYVQHRGDVDIPTYVCARKVAND